MIQELFKNGKKNEKGSITVFIVATMLLISGVLFNYYAKTLNKINDNNRIISRIEKQYSVTNDDLESKYNDALY